MSSRDNNLRQPSRLPNGAYYVNDDRIPVELSYPRVLPLALTVNERASVDPWWPFQESVLSLPSQTLSFPGILQNSTRVLVLQNGMPPDRQNPTGRTIQGNSILTQNEEKKALEKLKKEIYNPTPKRIIKRVNRFYREGNARKDPGQKGKLETEEDEEDNKRCTICLEDFEPKEVVVITTCNHMFHEDCIVPWLKSHGKCPVCRFTIYERVGDRGAAYRNSNNLVSDPLTSNLISFITAMEESRVSSTRGSSAAPFWF